MALLKVAAMGHPILRKVAAPLTEEEIKSERIQRLLADMIETMTEYDGQGLAAPQVHHSLQIAVLLWNFDSNKKPYATYLINPCLKPLTTETASYWEGCLSLPGLRGKVSRPNRISIEALNQRAEKMSFIAEGFAATVIQHECDHLLGKLYVDRMTDFTQFAFTREYQRYLVQPNEREAREGEG